MKNRYPAEYTVEISRGQSAEHSRFWEIEGADAVSIPKATSLRVASPSSSMAGAVWAIQETSESESPVVTRSLEVVCQSGGRQARPLMTGTPDSYSLPNVVSGSTRHEQQLQPVLQEERGPPHTFNSPSPVRLSRDRSYQLRNMGSKTIKGIDWILSKANFLSCIFLITTSAVLLLIFLQELIINNNTFNGRCIGSVLYPPWDQPGSYRKPTLIPFGYGACEANLGLRNTSKEMLMEPQNPTAGRCAYGVCASDKGWPPELVKNGNREPRVAATDSPNPRILNIVGALDTNKIRNYGEVYRVFWAANLHAGWGHLAINLLCMMLLLVILEPVWGFWRCLITWIVSATAGNLLSAVLDPCSISVGASGGVYGLLGALLAFSIESWEELRYPWCVLFIVVVFVALAQLLNMGQFSVVDNYAHMGGCLAGILVGFASIQSLHSLRKFSGSLIFNRLRLQLPYLSSTAKEALRKKIQSQEQQNRERFQRRTEVSGFVWSCQSGLLEWFVRATAATLLIAAFIALWLLLLNPAYYEQIESPGRISFWGSSGCHCCRIPTREQIINDPLLSHLPPHHVIRANAGAFWCFERQNVADFFCGKTFKVAVTSRQLADAKS